MLNGTFSSFLNLAPVKFFIIFFPLIGSGFGCGRWLSFVSVFLYLSLWFSDCGLLIVISEKFFIIHFSFFTIRRREFKFNKPALKEGLGDLFEGVVLTAEEVDFGVEGGEDSGDAALFGEVWN